MRFAYTWVFVTFLSCLGEAAIGNQPDPIKARLQKAKAAYQEVLNKQREAVVAALEKAVESARRSGDKSRVDQVEAERDAYEKLGDLPKAVSVAAYLKATKRARLTLAAR